MSIKRIIGITLIGLVFIIVVIGVMMFPSYLRRDIDTISLPDVQAPTNPPEFAEPDARGRVEISKDTVQAVISETITRPEIYNRDIVVEVYWDDGLAAYSISVNVAGDITALRIIAPGGIEKRVIVTADNLYIWYVGDRIPYIGPISLSSDGHKTADEWQMAVTYEDLANMEASDIVSAGYIEYNGINSIYADYRSPMHGYTGKCYVSIEHGLVIRAEEYDEKGVLVYFMEAEECEVGIVDEMAFVLPDGSSLLQEWTT